MFVRIIIFINEHGWTDEIPRFHCNLSSSVI